MISPCLGGSQLVRRVIQIAASETLIHFLFERDQLCLNTGLPQSLIEQIEARLIGKVLPGGLEFGSSARQIPGIEGLFNHSLTPRQIVVPLLTPPHFSGPRTEIGQRRVMWVRAQRFFSALQGSLILLPIGEFTNLSQHP